MNKIVCHAYHKTNNAIASQTKVLECYSAIAIELILSHPVMTAINMSLEYTDRVYV